MGRGARLLAIGVLATAAGCSPSGGPSLEARQAAPAHEASPKPSVEPLYARRDANSLPTEDGPPIGGPPRSELMRLPDAVPVAEPLSEYGNPHAYVVQGQVYRTLPTSRGYVERGIASWYGRKFHTRLTSTREPYDMFAMTAAHKSLPLPTYVRVTHLENGLSAVVRVNDRGPFHPGRIIDLSYAAAVKLGIAEPGSAPVEVRAIGTGPERGPGPPSETAAEPLRYFVQVGAYSNEKNASKALTMADRLRPGLASITSVEREERTLHRVRIGPLSGLDETDRLLDRLNEAGVRNARVVIEGRGKEATENDNA